MIEIVVHEHAFKHDWGSEEIEYAWRNFVVQQHRASPNEDKILAIGFDQMHRPIQMVARDQGDRVLIYHAMTPPSEKVLRELGMVRR